jgi:beta-lactamase superfamily II metal-dependent hydrolase
VVQDGASAALIDVGPSGEEGATTNKLVRSELRRLGVRRVELVVLSHPDADHTGGLPYLAKLRKIGVVVVSAYFRDDPEMQGTLAAAGIGADRVRWVEDVAEFRLGRFHFRVEAPDVEVGTSGNDASLVLKVTSGEAEAVFSGDAGAEVEEQLAAKGDWSADVLKASHHGSSGSASAAWLREVRPKLVVFSCGRDNAYGHPSGEAVLLATSAGCEVHRTDQQGTLELLVTPQGFARRR